MIVKPKIYQGSGTYKVRFFYWDVVGGVLTDKVIERYVNAGGTVIAPAIPLTLTATTKRSPALEFDSWNITTLTNIQQDMDVGAIYKNATDGGIRKTHAFIVVTATTGSTVPIYFNKSDGSTLTINWGDGSADYTTTSTGNVNTTHAYGAVGTYEIKMWISSGAGTYGFSNGSTTTSFIGGNSDAYRSCLMSLFIGDNVTTIGTYGIYRELKLEKLSIPNNITSIANSLCSVCTSLSILNVPNSVTSIGDSSFSSCTRLSVINLPKSLTSIGSSAFYGCSNLNQVIMYDSVATIGTACFYECKALKKLILSSIITAIPASLCSTCSSLSDIVIPATVTSIDANAFEYCVSLSEVNIPASVTAISDSAFYVANKIKKYVINLFTAPSTITTLASTAVFTSINAQCRIYVPVASGDVYKGATYWSTYANYIYEYSTENRALFGD